MGFIVWTVVVVWTAWAVFIVRLLHHRLRHSLLYLTKPDPNLQATCPPASRYDFVNLNEFKLYLGAIFLFPVRLLLAVPINLIFLVGIFIPKRLFNGMRHMT